MTENANPGQGNTGAQGAEEGLLSGTEENPEGAGLLSDDGKAEGESTPAVPETYELSVPEGMELAPEQLTAFTALAKEAKLPQAVAQKFVAFASEHVQQIQNKTVQDWQRQLDSWKATFKADQEFGGAKLRASLAGVREVISKYGDEDLMRDLRATGFENHPGLLRMLVRVSKVVGEDRLVRGGKPGSAPKTPSETFYD